jgi:hypothetical protein
MFSFWGRGGLSPFRILAWLFLVCLLISFSYAASTGPWSTPQERQQAEQNVEVMLGVFNLVGFGLVLVAVFGSIFLAMALGAWCYVRCSATTDPMKLAMSDPWLRKRLEQERALAAPPAGGASGHAGAGREPPTRVFEHDACGAATEVSGDDYLLLESPFRPVESAQCAGCGAFVPLDAVRWADSGEKVSDYRARVAASVPYWRRAWLSLFGSPRDGAEGLGRDRPAG